MTAQRSPHMSTRRLPLVPAQPPAHLARLARLACLILLGLLSLPDASAGAAPAASGSRAAPALAAATPASSRPTPAAESSKGQAAALGCLIQASNIVDIGAPVIGVLEAVHVERGDTVARGQLLAQLDASVERAAVALSSARANNQADVASAQSQDQYAKKRASRTAELTELRFVSAQAREQAETEASMASMKLAQSLEQRKLAEHELRLARAQLAQRHITSPINGVVVERYMNAGERVENRPILKLAQLDPLRVEVVLPAAQFLRVRPGVNARVTPDLPGAAALSASVAVVDRVIDAASNTFRARLMLPNRDHALPSGLRCRIEFAD